MFLVVLTRSSESFKSITALILAQRYFKFMVVWLAWQISNEGTISCKVEQVWFFTIILYNFMNWLYIPTCTYMERSPPSRWSGLHRLASLVVDVTSSSTLVCRMPDVLPPPVWCCWPLWNLMHLPGYSLARFYEASLFDLRPCHSGLWVGVMLA